ncbi:hypothetical protein LOZ53_000381 [Ophidiomyces ophidiicola]|nr:hypothetical protein LOZ55_002169 [Ophidiomyces ophidiicola]KAI1992212.1 hypothetical protein LOZ54_001828 [Ophidiomyces ophidiicola]KAI1997563.1 hypothetical protein LOZ53_000381 [Ophidiomyces ophidiicola]
MSRLADYRHDVYDVTCGALLGLSMAYFTYRRYYPSLKSIDCDIPYPTPDGGFTATSGIHPGLEDEEQRLYDPAGSQHPGSHYQMRDLSPDSQH